MTRQLIIRDRVFCYILFIYMFVVNFMGLWKVYQCFVAPHFQYIYICFTRTFDFNWTVFAFTPHKLIKLGQFPGENDVNIHNIVFINSQSDPIITALHHFIEFLKSEFKLYTNILIFNFPVILTSKTHYNNTPDIQSIRFLYKRSKQHNPFFAP